MSRLFVAWWVVDHDSDVRHATTTDPTALDDGTKVPRLCGGQIAHAKQGSRPTPRDLGIDTFCDGCTLQWAAESYEQHSDSRFYY